MSDTKPIDLSNFLINRPAPLNINFVTANDIKIAIICALAEFGVKCLLYNSIWRPAFSYLKLEKTDDESRKVFYTRANSIASSLVDQGVVLLEMVETLWYIMLKPNYKSALQSAITLYNECTPPPYDKIISVKDKTLFGKIETISRGFQLPENASDVPPPPEKRRIPCLTPMLENAEAERETTAAPLEAVPLEEMKAAYLKWFEESINYANEQKRKFKSEERFYASSEWGASSHALEEAKDEFLRLFSVLNWTQKDGTITE